MFAFAEWIARRVAEGLVFPHALIVLAATTMFAKKLFGSLVDLWCPEKWASVPGPSAGSIFEIHMISLLFIMIIMML